MPDRQFNWKRPAAEFLAIFAGVTLGLLADDFRDARADRERERAGLRLILADLEADTAELRTVIRFSSRRDRAAAQVLHLMDASIPQDSLGVLLREFVYGSGHNLQRSGFMSLRDTDRLSLITNDGLRASVIEYFDEAQMELEQTVAMEQARRDRLLAAMAPHVRWPKPEGMETTWPYEGGPVVLTSSWESFRLDGPLLWAVQDLGSLSQNAQAAADRLILRNADLRAAIGRELGR